MNLHAILGWMDGLFVNRQVDEFANFSMDILVGVGGYNVQPIHNGINIPTALDEDF